VTLLLVACSDYALTPPGRGVGEVDVVPGVLVFAAPTVALSVGVHNVGDGPLFLGVPEISGAAFALERGAAGTLGPGEVEEVTVAWTGADGVGLLTIRSDDADEPAIGVGLTGVAGTAPSECEATPAGAADVSSDPDCLGVAPAAPWDVVLEWEHSTGDGGVWTMPAVGRFSDPVTPDVAFVTAGGALTAVRGDGSTIVLQESGYKAMSGVVLADVTGDGAADLVAARSTGEVVALDSAGGEQWRSPPLDLFWSQITAGDLEGDGDVEVVAGRHVLDGTSGAVVVSLDPPLTDNPAPVLADLDGDGVREIALGEQVYAADGSPRWSVVTDGYTSFSAVFGDGAWFASSGVATAVDSAGAWRFDVALEPGPPGVPCVGDLDGDGDPEVVVPQPGEIATFHADGAPFWINTAPDDPAGTAGCSLADLDADGAFEVVYADTDQLFALNGRSGVILFERPHTSSTFTEYPVPADVDGDGRLELVVAASDPAGGFGGIRVYGNPGWPAGRTAWGIHDFAASNQGEDGSLVELAPRWDGWLRAAPGWPANAPDLAVAITGVCCVGGAVEVAYQVRNEGPADAPAGSEVVLYAVDGPGELALTSRALPAIPAGRALAGEVLRVTSTAAALRMRIEGPGIRCDVDDDRADATCPP
jgi:hypothetical protein